MPKTRDKKFKESFDIFMTNACNSGNFLRLNYNLINQTRNKTSHIHKYVLEILVILYVSIDIYSNKLYKVKYNSYDKNLLEFIY